MIATVKKYIDAIVSAQEDDGWICPCEKEKLQNPHSRFQKCKKLIFALMVVQDLE